MSGDAVKKMLIVSADGHSGAHPAEYREYLEKEYHEDLDAMIPFSEAWQANTPAQRRFSAETLDLMDTDGVVRSGGELGAYDFERRLTELDREGIACEVLIAGHQEAMLPFFHTGSLPSPPEERAAGARAYHRHLSDRMAAAGGRLVGIAEPGPCVDLDETVREMRWVAENGFVGIAPPNNVLDAALPPLSDARYEPFWEACVESDLALTLHAGYGFAQIGDQFLETMAAVVEAHGAEAFVNMSMMAAAETGKIPLDQLPRDSQARLGVTAPRRILWQMMVAGVFDRHPELRLVFTEVRADWVPDTLTLLDRYFADGHADTKLSPREYWHKHVYVAPSSPRPYEVAMRDEIGIDRFMFGMDYPHPEGTWPNTLDWIRHSFAGVTEPDARRMLGENAVECYRLDAAMLETVAEQIGPMPEDLLGEHTIDPAVLDQFHQRSGYLRPQETVDTDWYAEMIAEDEAAFASSKK
jgi:predicted TIM-barrel fold metal-dependent hydrolase